MDRRVAPLAFAAAAALVAGCGHEVTPSASGASSLAGRMLVKFRTEGTMDFARYDYVIVVNTCATGESDTPLPDVYSSTFTNYSYSFVVGASSGGVSTAFPLLFQYILVQDAADPLGPQPVPLDPSQTNLTLDSDGANDEFQLVFARSLLDNPKRVAQPCPNVPTGTASSTPATSASARYAQPVWYFNFFVLDRASRQPLDSLGIGGPMDASYSAPAIDTRITHAHPIDRLPDQEPPSATAAQIEGGSIENFM